MKRRLLTPLLNALFALLVTTPLYAQQELSGVVRFADGNPAPGIRVLFFDPSDLRRAFTATTNSLGHFSLAASTTHSSSALGANYPNPFNPSTAIPYALARPALVHLEIFNALGQRVRLLRDEFHAAGSYTAHWDGRNQRGLGVAAGVYFYRLATDGHIATGRMVLVDGSAAPASRSKQQTSPLGIDRAFHGDTPSARTYAATLSGLHIATKVLPHITTAGHPLALTVERRDPTRRAKLAADPILGDVNADGLVNISDALIVATYGIDPSIEIPNGGDITLGDVNIDGIVNISDALMLATYGIDPGHPALPDGIGENAIPPNRPPVLTTIGDKTTSVGTQLEIAVSVSDPDGDPINLILVEGPDGATFSDGNFSWTPTATGATFATFRADDGRGGSVEERIAISVVDLSLQLQPFLIETQAPSFVNILFQVRDNAGQGVDFLSTENFEVLENNRAVSPTESALQVRKKNTLPYTLRTVLMIDNSASVSTDLAQIKAAAIDLVRRIVPQQIIAVYKFSDSPVLMQDFTNEVDFLVAAIDGIQPEFATTDLYGAVARGAARWEDIYSTSEVQQGVLIVLTDGSDTQASTTLAQALAARGGKQVYTLGLGDEIEPEVLESLGNAGYFPLANAAELGASFTQIQTEIALAADSFYWLNYLSPKRGNNLHTLRLQVKGNALNSSISGQFNSADFYSVLPGVYVNVDSAHTEGIDTLSIFENDSAFLDAITYFATRPAQYSWSVADANILSVEANTGDPATAFAIARGDSGTATSLRVEDLANGFSRQLPVVITRVPFPTTDLIAYYPLDGNADDASDLEHHAQINGAISTSDRFGQANSAYLLDGINDYIEAEIDISETSYTLSLWFNTLDPDVGIYSATTGVLGSEGSDRHLYLSTGRLQARIFNSSEILATSRSYADGQWHHLVHVFGGETGGQRLYVDGDLRAIGTKAFSDFDRQSGINIGHASFAERRFFNGSLDDVRIYSRTLDEREIGKLFREKGWAD